jgi:hypothetical protein
VAEHPPHLRSSLGAPAARGLSLGDGLQWGGSRHRGQVSKPVGVWEGES